MEIIRWILWIGIILSYLGGIGASVFVVFGTFPIKSRPIVVMIWCWVFSFFLWRTAVALHFPCPTVLNRFSKPNQTTQPTSPSEPQWERGHV